MQYCEWCKTITDKLTRVTSQGTGLSYNICEKCLEAFDNSECRLCGGIIASRDITGLCISCAQEESEREQIIINEIAEGVNADILQEYTSGIVFTEDDYNKWVTMSQKPYAIEVIKRNRLAWLKAKLASSPEWTPERINRNINGLSELIDKYSSNLLKNTYKIIYYPEVPEPGERYKRPTAAILDRVGDIILVEV